MSKTNPINCSDVIDFIASDRCTPTERSRIIAALNVSRKLANSKAAYGFRMFQKVSFLNSRTGRTVTGRITKINTMSVNLTGDDGHNWRVSPALLTAVKEKGLRRLVGLGLVAFDPSKI